jgi:hypothetical protein
MAMKMMWVETVVEVNGGCLEKCTPISLILVLIKSILRLSFTYLVLAHVQRLIL